MKERGKIVSMLLCVLVLCGTITMVASAARQNYYSSLKVNYYHQGQTRDFTYQHIGFDFKRAYCNVFTGAVVGKELYVQQTLFYKKVGQLNGAQGSVASSESKATDVWWGNAIQNASPGNKKAYWYFSARNNVKADGSHEMIVIPDGCANIYSHN